MGWGAVLGGALGSVVPGVGTAIGAGLGGLGEQLFANDYNSAEASANRDWQSNMRNTSYQSAMNDMRAAGLNPMLAFSQGGASVPSGSTASYAAASDSSAAVASHAAQVSSAAAASQAETASRQVDSNVKLQAEQAVKAAAEAGLTGTALRQAEALIASIAQHYGVKLVQMSETDEALSKFFRETKIVPEVRAAAASVQEKINAEEFHKLINAPETSVFMRAVQLLLRGFSVMRSK